MFTMWVKRICFVGICLGALSGCSGGASLQAGLVRTGVEANPAVELRASGVAANTFYQIGINTVFSPEFVGEVQSDPSGNVAPRAFSFRCSYIITPPIYVGLYRNGLPVVQTTIFAMPCGF
jgi:hypothetical protein